MHNLTSSPLAKIAMCYGAQPNEVNPHVVVEEQVDRLVDPIVDELGVIIEGVGVSILKRNLIRSISDLRRTSNLEGLNIQ